MSELKCSICGADVGLHKAETFNCPKGGIEAPAGQEQIWLDTIFTRDYSEEIAQLKDTIAQMANISQPAFVHRDTDFCSTVVCPYCGAEDSNSWEIDFGDSMEGEIELECPTCSNTFIACRSVTIVYSTRKK